MQIVSNNPTRISLSNSLTRLKHSINYDCYVSNHFCVCNRLTHSVINDVDDFFVYSTNNTTKTTVVEEARRRRNQQHLHL